MFIKTDSLHIQLSRFGLSHDEVTVYLYLLEHGFQTVLQLSRQLSLGRTKIYRLLDELRNKGLINQKLASRGLEFGALSYRQLEILLIDKEKELIALKESTPIIFEHLQKLIPVTNGNSQVLYYSGRAGLEQVTWNSTKAKDILRIYEIADMDAFLDHDTAELMRRKDVENNVHIKQLTNATYIAPYTDVEGKVDIWQARHIPVDKLRIQFEVMIYNEVYTIYNYSNDDDIFCVEIYNKELAQMQEELFDFVWSYAKEMQILNNHGEATLSTKP